MGRKCIAKASILLFSATANSRACFCLCVGVLMENTNFTSTRALFYVSFARLEFGTKRKKRKFQAKFAHFCAKIRLENSIIACAPPPQQIPLALCVSIGICVKAMPMLHFGTCLLRFYTPASPPGCVCVCMYMCICVYIYMYVYVYVHVCVCVHVCACVCVCVFPSESWRAWRHCLCMCAREHVGVLRSVCVAVPVRGRCGAIF